MKMFTILHPSKRKKWTKTQHFSFFCNILCYIQNQWKQKVKNKKKRRNRSIMIFQTFYVCLFFFSFKKWTIARVTEVGVWKFVLSFGKNIFFPIIFWCFQKKKKRRSLYIKRNELFSVWWHHATGYCLNVLIMHEKYIHTLHVHFFSVFLTDV